jgi:predicted nucleic acid-binding protein
VILLDTSVLSRVFRRSRLGPTEQRVRETFARLMESESALGLPGIVLQEVLSGIRSDKQFAELELRLLSAFTIVLPSANDHIEAARLKTNAWAKGLPRPGRIVCSRRLPFRAITSCLL